MDGSPQRSLYSRKHTASPTVLTDALMLGLIVDTHNSGIIIVRNKKGRRDVQMSVSFLCTRVSKSTENVWLKLRRLLKFLSQTIDESLILRVENFSHSFAVHGDIKSHTEGASSYCRGTFIMKSSKQRLNTLSSTEAELVGFGEYPQAHGVWLQKVGRARAGVKLS